MRDGGADSGHLVGCHGDTHAGAADEQAAVGFALCDEASAGDGDVRVVDILTSTQANIDDCVDPGVGFEITFEDLLVFDASTVRGDNDCKTHGGIPSSIIQKLRCSWSPKGDGSIVASAAHPLTSVHVRVFPPFCYISCLSEHAHFCAQGHKSTQNTPTMW